MTAPLPSTATQLAGAIRSSIHLRWYQADMKRRIYEAWAMGAQNVLAVGPTGMGKTVLFSDVLHDHTGSACAIAHRQELVGQIAAALNRAGVRFRLIAQPATIRTILADILKDQGISFYDPGAQVAVASVNTLVNIDKGKKAAQYAQWRAQVTLWVQDEAHHVLEANQWGRATLMFPNANCKGLGVTASPKRADGAGLGRHADGLFDVMVLGPTMRELIDDGYLTPYQIYTVPCRVDYDHLNVGASGDFAQARLAAEEDGTGLVGDIVSEYLRIAKGKRGVTFVSSVEKAHEVAEAFNAAGVPAMALSGQSDDADRARGVRMLASGELLQLVNCDLFGEGFDLPAIEVVSMGTATASLARYMQWFGRALRLMLSREVMAGYDALTSEQRRAAIAASVKPFALIIDHGGNVIRHDGPPDVPRVWTLDRYSRRSAPGETVPYRVCANPGYVLADPGGLPWADYRDAGLSNADMLAAGLLVDRRIPCAAPYERIHTLCPYCGFFPEPASRSTPEAVEGELQLLDAETLAALYAEIPPTMDEFRAAQTMGLPHMVAQRHRNDHAARLGELEHLKHVMMWWGGYWSAQGHTDAMVQRRFWHTFGIDVLTAQTLKRADAEALRGRIEAKSAIDGIVIPQYSEPN